MYLSDDEQANNIDAFNTTCTSRYLDDISNINNIQATLCENQS